MEHTDTERLEWVMDILQLTDCEERVADAKVIKLAGMVMAGKTGREAIDLLLEPATM